ncbi:GNAT family N-acetyltransferase [Clostridia bacterium OttesenSCG-928-O13]|nr:GNAT family N-acetyltransferase [Clostridia bacterium OttesenSCG-928-O13]
MREIRFIDDSEPKALKDALALVRNVFWEFDAEDYSDEGILEFSDYIEYDSIQAMLQSGELVMMGCYQHNRLAGVLALRVPGHISLLFVGKAYQRQGIARALLDTAIRCVRQITGEKALTVNAAPYATAIYQKMGFMPTDGEQLLNGIRFIPMRLDIGQ